VVKELEAEEGHWMARMVRRRCERRIRRRDFIFSGWGYLYYGIFGWEFGWWIFRENIGRVWDCMLGRGGLLLLLGFYYVFGSIKSIIVGIFICSGGNSYLILINKNRYFLLTGT
jgi:hypothetical protein